MTKEMKAGDIGLIGLGVMGLNQRKISQKTVFL